MDKKNKIQSILDAYLNFKKSKAVSENVADGFWNKQNDLDRGKEDVQASKDFIQLFSDIKLRDLSLKQESKFDELNKKIDFAEKTTIPQPFINNKFKTLLKVAAVVLPIAVLTSLFVYFINKNSEPDHQMVASTLKGSKTKLELEDGTKVWLNGESELRFPPTFKNKNKRTVYLTGEAFFEVTKNEKKPFEVYAKGYKVNVLGTSFNVKAYPDDETLEATLEHGKVDIEKLLDFDKKETKRLVSLKPNQTIVIYNDKIIDKTQTKPENVKDIKDTVVPEGELKKKDIYIIESNDLAPYISWKDNKLTFKNEPLLDVASDLERWYNIEVKLADEELNNIKFTATFTTETVEQAIYAICVASKIDYEINKNTVVLKTIKNK